MGFTDAQLQRLRTRRRGRVASRDPRGTLRYRPDRARIAGSVSAE